MRRDRLSLFLMVGLLAAGGCELQRTGTACKANDDCASGKCFRGKCTYDCSGQGDCPIGFDCVFDKAGDKTATCVAPRYKAPEKGGFATPCSVASVDPMAPDKGVCDPKSPNPCAEGFFCRSSQRCDGNAYCTAACQVDRDCPINLFCARLEGGECADDSECPVGRKCDGGLCKGRMCLKRNHCTPCELDDQCPKNFYCVTGGGGERFCAKSCGAENDCPQPLADELGFYIGSAFQACQTAERSGLPSVRACLPVGGCHGPSAIDGVDGENTVCSSCRQGFPEDCADGTFCFYEEFSTERFCTKPCSATLVEQKDGYAIGNDTCQKENKSMYCFFGGGVPQDCGASCSLDGICVADPNYVGLTCHALAE